MGCMLKRTANAPIPIIARDFHHTSISLLGIRDETSLKRMVKNLRNQAKQEEKKVIPTIIKGKYSGDGIRKTKAYETKLTEQEYDEVRNLFWESKIGKNESIWRLLKIICESDYCIHCT